MACVTLEEIAADCERNTGGLHEVLFGDMDDISAITETAASWSVTAMTVLDAPISLNIKRKTSNYIQDEQQEMVNGSVVVTTTVTLKLHRRSAMKSRALNILGSGQRYLYGFLKDGNGKWWYVPYLQLQSVGGGSGQERADGSNYDIVLVGENSHLAYEVSDAIVAAAIAVS